MSDQLQTLSVKIRVICELSSPERLFLTDFTDEHRIIVSLIEDLEYKNPDPIDHGG